MRVTVMYSRFGGAHAALALTISKEKKWIWRASRPMFKSLIKYKSLNTKAYLASLFHPSRRSDQSVKLMPTAQLRPATAATYNTSS